MEPNEDKNKEEIQITPRERIALALAKTGEERKGKCELLLKEIDSIVQKIRDSRPKEDALISFEERKREQEALIPLKNEYNRKRVELSREMNFITDSGFHSLVNEHFLKLDKVIYPADAEHGLSLSGQNRMISELRRREVKEIPASNSPVKTESKTATFTGISEEARQKNIEINERIKKIGEELEKTNK